MSIVIDESQSRYVGRSVRLSIHRSIRRSVGASLYGIDEATDENGPLIWIPVITLVIKSLMIFRPPTASIA